MKQHTSKNVDAEKRFEQSDDEGASVEPVCLVLHQAVPGCSTLMLAFLRMSLPP